MEKKILTALILLALTGSAAFILNLNQNQHRVLFEMVNKERAVNNDQNVKIKEVETIQKERNR